MPRYFFHTIDGTAYHDDDGTELASANAAAVEAARLIGALLQEDADEFWRSGSICMTVTDETGLSLLTISISGAPGPAAEPGLGVD